MPLPALAPFLSFVLIASFTPGPNNLLSMTTAHQYGMKTARKLTFGIATAFTLIMFFTGLFDAALLAWMPVLQWPLKIVGAAYMVYLAVKTLMAKPLSEDGESKPMKNPYWVGFGMSFINPKLYLCAITVMTVYLIPLHPSAPVLAMYALFLGIVCLCAVTSWAFFGTLFKRTFNQHARLINAILAGLLVYCAVALFL